MSERQQAQAENEEASQIVEQAASASLRSSSSSEFVLQGLNPFKVGVSGLPPPLDLRKPPPELGKRVMAELAGYETFRGLSERTLAKARGSSGRFYARTTVTATAKILGISRAAVYKIARAYLKGGEAAVEALNFGRARAIKNAFFSQSEIDAMVSRATLTSQASMSLRARALQFTQRFGKPLSAGQLRAFYKGRGITQQKPQIRLGPFELPTAE